MSQCISLRRDVQWLALFGLLMTGCQLVILSPKCLPPSYDVRNEVLLVVLGGIDEKVDGYVERAFAKYRGRYRIITPRQLDSNRFREVAEYRFTFEQVSVGYGKGGRRVVTFVMRDRRKGRTYQTMETDLYQGAIDAYVEGLNELGGEER